ncbi:MAG: UDP-N-acetylmuramate--L-alanine ligase [Limnochordia bacterium]
MEQYAKLHFVGIGGAGMSGIARLLAQRGVEITGSDLVESPRIDRLRQLGIKVFIGHRAENLLQPQGVVVSSAVSPTNVELVEARKRGIPILSRAQMLGRLMADYDGIAIAGTHGKTTTTAMIGHMLAGCDANPIVVIGGECRDTGSNVRCGLGPHFVAEADESDGSFLELSPKTAVITNIEADHLEHYGSFGAIIDAFQAFLEKLPSDGLAILCSDDPQIKELLPQVKKHHLCYGFLPGAHVRGGGLALGPQGSRCPVYHGDRLLGTLELRIPGRHNMLNALAAVAVGLHLGYPFSQITDALASFAGVNRRFHIIGERDDVLVVDDYAHHPTEIKATLAAARTLGRRVIVVFQPHRYSRTYHLAGELATAFEGADEVIITDIYAAGEAPIAGVSGEVLAEGVAEQKGSGVHYCGELGAIPGFLETIAQSGDLVLTMGAGNIDQVAHAYLNGVPGQLIGSGQRG